MKGIMFSAPLVREIQKTKVDEVRCRSLLQRPYKIETRRLLPRQPIPRMAAGQLSLVWEYYPGREVLRPGLLSLLPFIETKARYKVGDEVYIKETSIVNGNGKFVGYAADLDTPPGCKLKSAMFMPYEWSRMEVIINEVRVVRVCDIRICEALAEGFETKEDFWNAWATINGVSKRPDMVDIFMEARGTGHDAYYRKVLEFNSKDYASGDIGRDVVFQRAGELCFAYQFLRTR